MKLNFFFVRILTKIAQKNSIYLTNILLHCLFNITLGQCNTSLLNRSTNFFKKKQNIPELYFLSLKSDLSDLMCPFPILFALLIGTVIDKRGNELAKGQKNDFQTCI